jgi:hypothetical protein
VVELYCEVTIGYSPRLTARPAATSSAETGCSPSSAAHAGASGTASSYSANHGSPAVYDRHRRPVLAVDEVHEAAAGALGVVPARPLAWRRFRTAEPRSDRSDRGSAVLNRSKQRRKDSLEQFRPGLSRSKPF